MDKNGNDTSQFITFSHAEGQELMSKNRFIKAIDNLIELGFITLIRHLPQSKQITIYGLSDRWQNYGQENFKTETRPKWKCGKTKI